MEEMKKLVNMHDHFNAMNGGEPITAEQINELRVNTQIKKQDIICGGHWVEDEKLVLDHNVFVVSLFGTDGKISKD